MNQEDHNKTEKNLITLLNWYRLKRVNDLRHNAMKHKHGNQSSNASATVNGYECTPIGAALPLPAC